MKLAPETREILRQYKALINARRRDAGQGKVRDLSGSWSAGWYPTS